MSTRTFPDQIIITDPGVDDAIALLVASAIMPSTAYISTYGNAQTSLTTKNLNGMVNFINSSAKKTAGKAGVFIGADRRLGAKTAYIPEGGNLFFIHGDNVCEGIFNQADDKAPKSDELYSKLKRSIDIISVGATTELRKILKKKRNIVTSVTMMGGVLFGQGNITPHVEANLANDPKATMEVLDFARTGNVPLTIVPLDLTQHEALILTDERLEKLKKKLRSHGSKNVLELVDKLVGKDSTYRKFYKSKEGVYEATAPYKERYFKGPAIHDLTAILVKHHPELFVFSRLPIVILEDGAMGVPTSWMDMPQEKILVAVDIKDPDMYWQKTAEYLSAYK